MRIILLLAVVTGCTGAVEHHGAERPTVSVCTQVGAAAEECTSGWASTPSNGAVTVDRGTAQDARGCVEPRTAVTVWPESESLPAPAADVSADLVVDGCRFRQWALVDGAVSDVDPAAFTLAMQPIDDGSPGTWDCRANAYRTARCDALLGTVVRVRTE